VIWPEQLNRISWQRCFLILLLLAGGTQLITAIDSPGYGQRLGILVGSVTKGPLSPVEQQPGGAPPSMGVAGARIDIATAKGKPLTSVVTDSGGTFRVQLPPGTYKLTMPSLYGAMFANDLPAIVTIAASEVKRVDIHLDTGIR